MKKYAEIVFMCGKMKNGDGLNVLEERMRALNPKQNEVYKFLGFFLNKTFTNNN